MPSINRQWLLRSRPQGSVRPEDFAYREQPMPEGPLRDGEIRIRNLAFRCSPTHRNWMDPPGNSLYPSMPLGEPVLSAAAGVVVASANEAWQVGDRLLARSGWEDYSTHGPASLAYASKIPDGLSDLEALGRYGLNPLTGYFGLLAIGRPHAGETLVVSAAAGATGSTAAQIGMIRGLRVIGIAGGAAKCEWLVRDCGLDAVIDYKSEDVSARLGQLCPGDIDVYYDNVGGDILQAAVDHMARFGRIVLCGQIAAGAAWLDEAVVRDRKQARGVSPAAMQGWLEPVAGALVLAITLLDVFLTVLYARAGTGLLAPRLARGMWRVFRALAGGRHTGLLNYCGPAQLVALIVMWGTLLALGAALMIHPGLGSGVESSSGSTDTDFITALLVGGSSMSIVGASDYGPTTRAYKLLFLFASLVGMSVTSLTITYVMQIYTAVRSRNTLALAIHAQSGESGDAAELVARWGPRGRFDGGYNNLSTLAGQVAAIKEAHHFYPVLLYFRFDEPLYAPPRALLVALDAAALIRTALDPRELGWLRESAALEELERG